MPYTMQDELFFFEQHRAIYPLYRRFADKLMSRHPETRVKVQKTQISFSNRHVYACVSLMRVKKKAELPPSYFVLTLGLPAPPKSERIAAKTEPYPGRWTAHIIVSEDSDLDETLFDWVEQAYAFALKKQDARLGVSDTRK